MTQSFLFPPLSISSWQPTRDTIHDYARLLGKIRGGLTPEQKHFWHVSLQVTAVGLTTTPLLVGDKTAEFSLDFTNHCLNIQTSRGESIQIALHGQSPAALCTETDAAMIELSFTADYDRSLFTNDSDGVYDKTAVSNYWQALSHIDVIFKQFRHSFREESSPVQLWPHHFDLALLWFSGRLVSDQDPANPEIADEQMNFGFVPGDASIAEPYFYATTYPTPDKITEEPLPQDAYWHTEEWTGAILPYASLTQAEKPSSKLLDYLHNTHQAGKKWMENSA